MRNRDKSKKISASILANSAQNTSSIISESMNFEDCIIQSSKRSGSFSREWIEAEVKKSSDYFTREIYSTT